MTLDDCTEYKWDTSRSCSHEYIFPILLNIIKELNLDKDSKILDAGCGAGDLVNELYKEMGFNNIYGFDTSTSGIQIAKDNTTEISNNFCIHNGYEVTLPPSFPSKYDLVISSEVLEHLINPKDFLLNANKWLNKRGFILITTPYHGYVKNFLTSLVNKWDKHFDSLKGGGHVKFFSKKTLYKLLNETGFKPIKFYGTGRFSFIWKSMVILSQKV